MADVFESYPVESSFQNLLHYSQMDAGGRFGKLDLGPAGNLARYGSIHPPQYSLSDMEVPTAVYYGLQDKFVTAHRSALLVQDIRVAGNLLESIALDGYGHADFVWGLDAHERVYAPLIRQLEMNLQTGENLLTNKFCPVV